MAFLTKAANRGSIATGYEIDNSCSFYDSDRTTTGTGANAHLDFTPSSTSNRKTGTFSSWVKRTYLDDIGVLFSSGTNQQHLRFNSNGVINIRDYNESTSLTTNAVFRDTSAWYHFVMAIDTTQSTASNRIKLYVNGDQITSFASAVYPTQNQDWNFNYSSSQMFIGARRWPTGGSNIIQGLDAYVAETNWIDGQQLTPSDFGEYDEDSSIWKPKKYTGSYGTNGFYLDFESSGSLGADSSGNSNNFTLNNITSADQATDTPTNNFAHWNPLMAYDGNEGRSEITEGGTTLKNSNTGNGSSNGWYGGAGTIPVTSGKWYWEYQPFAGTFGYHGVGIMGADFISDDVDDIRDYCPNLYLRNGATPTIYQHLQSGNNTAYKTMTSWTSNSSDIFAIALNMDDEEITFYRNGTAITENGTSNTTFSISSVIAQSSPIIFHYQSYANGTGIYFNFGGYTEMSISSAASDANGYGTFEYAPPSGYYALCTKNLAEYG